MELPTYFSDFLKEIRLTKSQVEDCKSGHQTLSGRLKADEHLSPIIVSTFLQGSYRRSTAVRPHEDKRADVDVIVVTKLSQDEYTPAQALNLFIPFLEKHYKGKYDNTQGRSIGINLSYVDLDLVVTSHPSESEEGILESKSVTTDETLEEAEDWRLVGSWLPYNQRGAYAAKAQMAEAMKAAEWQLSPLYIPDREVKRWQPTHPIEQIRFTYGKNKSCNKHYVNVVKAIKWWRHIRHAVPKYPKSYPLEHLIGLCCPDGITSVAAGVVRSLENISSNYQDYAQTKTVPFLPDHGVPEHNVFKRISGEDFALFHSQVSEAAKIARKAFDATTPQTSVDEWKKLFGDKFPDAPPGGEGGDNDPSKGGYTPRAAVTTIAGGRFGLWQRTLTHHPSC